MRTSFTHRQYLNLELAKAKEAATNPSTKWLSEDEFWVEFEEGL